MKLQSMRYIAGEMEYPCKGSQFMKFFLIMILLLLTPSFSVYAEDKTSSKNKDNSAIACSVSNAEYRPDSGESSNDEFSFRLYVEKSTPAEKAFNPDPIRIDSRLAYFSFENFEKKLGEKVSTVRLAYSCLSDKTHCVANSFYGQFTDGELKSIHSSLVFQNVIALNRDYSPNDWLNEEIAPYAFVFPRMGSKYFYDSGLRQGETDFGHEIEQYPSTEEYPYIKYYTMEKRVPDYPAYSDVWVFNRCLKEERPKNLSQTPLLPMDKFVEKPSVSCAKDKGIYKPQSSYPSRNLDFEMEFKKAPLGPYSVTSRMFDVFIHAYDPSSGKRLSSYRMSAESSIGAQAQTYFAGLDFTELYNFFSSKYEEDIAPSVYILHGTDGIKFKEFGKKALEEGETPSSDLLFYTNKKVIPDFRGLDIWVLDRCKK